MCELARPELDARVNKRWRSLCRTDELARRNAQPRDDSPLPELAITIALDLEEAADRATEELTRELGGHEFASAGLRQLTLLQEAVLDSIGDDPTLARNLARRIAQIFEDLSQIFIARSDETALRDHLTGLLNPRAFEADFSRAMDRLDARLGTAVLVNLDVDGLRVANEVGGHDLGDTYLKHAASEFAAAASRIQATVYRKSGDEFMILARDTELDQVKQCMDALVARPECPPISFGIVSLNDDVEEVRRMATADGSPLAEQVEKLADQRMYEMKNANSPETRADGARVWLTENHVGAI